MPKPQIRIRLTDDLDVIEDLNNRIFPGEPLGADLEGSTWWLAEAFLDGAWEPVGFAGLQITDAGKYAFCNRDGVLPSARGAGIQKRTLRTRETWARRQGLEALWTYIAWWNTASQTSYVRAGFNPYSYMEESNGYCALYFQKALTAR